MSVATLRLLSVLVAFLSVVPTAGAASVKEVFEKYNLLGTWALDCNKPASQNNWYFVNRLLDANRVQRDFMTSEKTRGWSAILEKAAELGPNEITIDGTRDGERTMGIWRIEQNRMQQWYAMQAGKPLISSGKSVATGKDMPWLNKCGSR